MMAVDVKRLNSAEKIDLDRALSAGAKAAGQTAMNARLLACASTTMQGKRQWFALRTSHCSETELCKGLVDSDVDAVVPVKQVQGKRRGTRPAQGVIHRPVLPGLVFVNVVPSDAAFAGLLRVKGIASVIGSARGPHAIGDREMLIFMDLAQKGAFDERVTATGIKVGAKVRIKDGPFAEFEGVLQGYVRSRGVRVLAHLLGGMVPIDLTLAQIEKAE